MPSGTAGSKSPFHSGRRITDVPRTSCALLCRLYAAVPQLVEALFGRQLVGEKPACRFESCLRRYHIWRRVLTGRQPVPNTGDPKGSGGSNPPVFAYKPLWQNWQMHLPAKQGPVDPASGVGTGSGAHTGSNWFSWFFLKTCNKALKLYYEYNDKAFKRCYSGCQKK